MADAKFEVYNADGTLQIDLGNRLFRTLGEVETGTSDGSHVFAGLSGQTAVVAVQTEADDDPRTPKQSPKVTVSGNTVSWSFTGNNPKKPARLAVVLF